MNNIIIPIKLLSADINCPEYALPGCSGVDLCAAIDNEVEILPGKRALIPTGIKLEIPEGFEGQVRPRSGLALRHGVTVLNSPGTVDASYRGEICVILINLGQDSFIIQRGMRIAQLVIAAVVRVNSFIPVDQLSASLRQEQGFGSTGILSKNAIK